MSTPTAGPQRDAREPPSTLDPPESENPLLAAATRIESLIREEREDRARARLHRDFSYARFGGALAQGVVVALLIWALADCLLGARVTDVHVKLMFAAVLQGAVIAAFVAARGD